MGEEWELKGRNEAERRREERGGERREGDKKGKGH
jgi:hypothetical protein